MAPISSRLVRRTPIKKNKLVKDVYLYLCHVGKDTYKMGATKHPEQRRKQIRTYTPQAKMHSVVRLPANKGSQWSKLETAVLRRFAACRTEGGGREVLRLDGRQAAACVRYMRSVCGRV